MHPAQIRNGTVIIIVMLTSQMYEQDCKTAPTAPCDHSLQIGILIDACLYGQLMRIGLTNEHIRQNNIDNALNLAEKGMATEQ